MMNDEAKRLLAEPLNRASVKERKQGGRQVSYIEGWHAIAEANRIFGFDGWTRETVDLKCVSERERKIGDSGSQGWGVTYTARVRICVGHVTREGCGAGHGIDRDLGQAHESALKEAETDAMKRGLMTFGNPFGLALYDKTQADVSNVPVKRAPRQAVAREDGPREATVRKLPDPLVQAAGIICGEAEFWKYLGVANADNAAQIVRDRCKIKSRSELATNSDAARLWRELVAGYRTWQREQAIIDQASPHRQQHSPADQGAAAEGVAAASTQLTAAAPEGEPESERLARVEAILAEAAGLGMTELQACWKHTAAADQKIFKMALDRRFKPTAEAADRARAGA